MWTKIWPVNICRWGRGGERASKRFVAIFEAENFFKMLFIFSVSFNLVRFFGESSCNTETKNKARFDLIRSKIGWVDFNYQRTKDVFSKESWNMFESQNLLSCFGFLRQIKLIFLWSKYLDQFNQNSVNHLMILQGDTIFQRIWLLIFLSVLFPWLSVG